MPKAFNGMHVLFPFLIIWCGYVSTKKEIKLSEDLACLREILDVVVIYDNFPSF